MSPRQRLRSQAPITACAPRHRLLTAAAFAAVCIALWLLLTLEFGIGPELDSPSRDLSLGRAEPAVLSPGPSLSTPNLVADSAELGRRASGPDPTSEPVTSLAIRVRRDNGLPAAHATVFIFGPTVFRGRCDEHGELSLPVAAGAYEVLIPSEGFDDFVALYPPDGLSSVETVAVEGRHTEVQLVAYAGGRLHCSFVDAAGEPTDPGGVRVFVWDEERWHSEATETVGPDGRLVLEGLEPKSYGLASVPGAALFFEPLVVTVEPGEERFESVTAHAARQVDLTLTLRSQKDGPSLPLGLSIDAQLQGPWSPPARRTLVKLSEDSVTEPISLSLFPGRYDLSFKTSAFMRERMQIVEDREWLRELVVPVEGDPVPPSFEFLLEELGDLALVDGHLLGPRSDQDTKYSLRYLDAEGKTRRRGLWIPRDTFELVVDLERVSGALFEFVQRQEDRPEAVLGARRLSSGRQRWELTRPPN